MSGNDGSTDTVFIGNTAGSPTTLGTSFPEDVQVDWAAGVYFVLSNGGPDGSNGEVLMGHLNSSAAPTVVYTAPTSDLLNTLQIDPITHHVYVGKLDAGGDETLSGVLDFTYSPATTTTLALTPVSTNSGWLFTTSQVSGLPDDPAVGFPVLDPRAMTLDHATNSLFFVNELDGGADENQIYKVDLSNPTHVTALTEASQFPVTTDGSAFTNGYITGVQVDPSTQPGLFHHALATSVSGRHLQRQYRPHLLYFRKRQRQHRCYRADPYRHAERQSLLSRGDHDRSAKPADLCWLRAARRRHGRRTPLRRRFDLRLSTRRPRHHRGLCQDDHAVAGLHGNRRQHRRHDVR